MTPSKKMRKLLMLVLFFVLFFGYVYLDNKKESSAEKEISKVASTTDTSFNTDKKICETLPVTEKQKGVAPSGTIDTEALSINSYSEASRITGTFKNTGGIQVYIWKGDIKIPSPLPENFSPAPISADFSDHGGELDYCPIGSGEGRYFSKIKKPLQKGTYTIGVYTYDNIYTDGGYQGNTPSLLIASGTLLVKN